MGEKGRERNKGMRIPVTEGRRRGFCPPSLGLLPEKKILMTCENDWIPSRRRVRRVASDSDGERRRVGAREMFFEDGYFWGRVAIG